jgi:hypothetical protein
VQNLEELAEDILACVQMLSDEADDRPSVTAMGETCNQLAALYRSLGILALLIAANSDAFFHALIQAAITRRYFLDRCLDEGVFAHAARRASFVGPFLDAVAADQLGLARQIADASPDDWMQGDEYEDDFAYAAFLHDLVAVDDRGDRCRATLERFEQALEGGIDLRLDVCRALLERDQASFDEAFAPMLADYDRRMTEIADPKRDSILAQDYNFEPNRRIFVEGLALLRLAEARGIAVEREYPLCPGLVRRPQHPNFSPIGFPGLGLTR